MCYVFVVKLPNNKLKTLKIKFLTRTNASRSSIAFFDTMEPAIRGIQSTVPVTSLVAYKTLSAGFNSDV